MIFSSMVTQSVDQGCVRDFELLAPKQHLEHLCIGFRCQPLRQELPASFLHHIWLPSGKESKESFWDFVEGET